MLHCVAIIICIATMLKNLWLGLLSYHLLQRLPTKVILLLSESIATNMALLQHYFIIVICKKN
jgi:hypothetical protein